MTDIIELLEKFLTDEDNWEMYISGSAGTGKTTSLKKCLKYCVDNNINTLTCAHTHKACKVIRETIGTTYKVSTLHSFLNKRPGINDEATKKDEVDFIIQLAIPNAKGIVFIDEYSMISKDDYKDIILAQDPGYTGKPKFKVCFLGDPNQLPPVGEEVGVKPKGDYDVKLTKIWRQSDDNPLLDTLTNLISYITNEKTPEPLGSNLSFLREQDLFKIFNEVEDPILLAYTNEAVELWNRRIKGREYLEIDDDIFSPTTRETYVFNGNIPRSQITFIDLPRDRTLSLGSKYKTLEFLLELEEVEFGRFDNKIFAYIFGHYQNKKLMEILTSEASNSNKLIQDEYGIVAKDFAEANPSNPLVRKRAKAWRKYLSIKDAAICVDFPFATTIHKAQGSTYMNVLLDAQDLNRCSNMDTYLRLWYVALSRAREKVFTN